MHFPAQIYYSRRLPHSNGPSKTLTGRQRQTHFFREKVCVSDALRPRPLKGAQQSVLLRSEKNPDFSTMETSIIGSILSKYHVYGQTALLPDVLRPQNTHPTYSGTLSGPQIPQNPTPHRQEPMYAVYHTAYMHNSTICWAPFKGSVGQQCDNKRPNYPYFNLKKEM